MKKKAICILVSFIFATMSLLSQVSVGWGTEQKGTSGNDEREQSYILGPDENEGYYSLREKVKSFNFNATPIKRFIEHFDKDGNLIGSEKFKLEAKGGERYFDGVFYNEGKMYLLTYHLRRKDNMNVLSVQDIDPKTLMVSEHIKELAAAPYKYVFIWDPINFLYYQKTIGDKTYFFHRTKDKKSGKTIIRLWAFDLDFNLLWKHVQTLEYPEKLFGPESFEVDQNGTVRILAAIYKDKKRKIRKGKPNYSYHFFIFADQGKSYKEHRISLADKLITDIQFQYNPNGEISCAGFYSDKFSFAKSSNVAGAFYLAIDPHSTETILENYMAFDDKLLSYFLRESAVEKGKEIQDLELRNLQFLEDGSAILLAEEYTQYTSTVSMSLTTVSYSSNSYATYKTTTTTTTTTSWTNYNFDNILALRINPEGKIEWARVIEKKQHTKSDGGIYSSYAPAFVGDKIYLIYNDNTFRKNKDAVVVCAEINYDGNINKQALFSAREAETLTCPKSCRQISANSLGIYGSKGKKYKWGLIKFQ